MKFHIGTKCNLIVSFVVPALRRANSLGFGKRLLQNEVVQRRAEPQRYNFGLGR